MKEIMDYIFDILVKLWRILYIPGLKGLYDLAKDYKQKNLLPFLNDALEMSEEWKRLFQDPNGIIPESNQCNTNIAEEEKIKKLKENITFFKKQKERARVIPNSLHLLRSQRSYVDTLNSELSINNCFEKIDKLPIHILISKDKLKITAKNHSERLGDWNTQLQKYKVNMKLDSHLKTDPYQVHYVHYLLFLNLSVDMIDDLNQIIKELRNLIWKHRCFLLAIVIFLLWIFLKDTY